MALNDVLTEDCPDEDVLEDDSLAEDILNDELTEDGLGVVLGEEVLEEVLAGEDPVDAPVPHPQSDVHVCGLRVVLGNDQAAVLPCLHFRERG